MSADSWFADYAAGSFLPPTTPQIRHARAESSTSHGPEWWDGFSAGLTDAAGTFSPEDPDASEWLGNPWAVAGYLFVHLTHSAVTVDAGAVRLDRAVEDAQRLLEHLGVEPAAPMPSNVLPFKVRPVKGGAR